jgi:hypothetical protein
MNERVSKSASRPVIEPQVSFSSKVSTGVSCPSVAADHSAIAFGSPVTGHDFSRAEKLAESDPGFSPCNAPFRAALVLPHQAHSLTR